MFKPALGVLILTAALWPGSLHGGILRVNEKRWHLGTPGDPEWERFAAHAPDARRLELPFKARTNAEEATLFVRQDDVKQDWGVELNGRRLGKLFLMEADLVHTLAIPRGALRDGTNVLTILPPATRDDILIDEIRIDSRSPSRAIAEGNLSAEVTDAESGGRIPFRLTVTDRRGTLVPLAALSNAPPAAIRPGVAYANGQLTLGLPAGDYTVYATRGFEWSVATQQVHLLAQGQAHLAFVLRREVPTPGLVSCDTHVHTFTFSRHGDATQDERLLTLAGEGIELPIATDHNCLVDNTEPVRRLDLTRWFTPVIGDEVTTPAGHFNIFPIEPNASAPGDQVTDWPVLMRELRATPGVRVVALNHPRNIHTGFQPFAATNFNAVSGRNLRGPDFSFDAMEVLNSSAQQTDYLLVYRDWFALLNHGYRVTGLGSSDGHDVSRYIVGQGRTYIACPDADPGRLNVSVACSNLLAGRACVSMGLLTTLHVNDRFGVGDLATGAELGPQMRVTVRVLGPAWVTATNVTLFGNGLVLRQEQLDPANASGRRASPGIQAVVTWQLPRPDHDIYLVAIATGPAVTAPFWAIPHPYQPVSTHWEGRVIGSTNPIWIDGDGDGRFTPARGYAQALVKRHGLEPMRLLPALAGYDEAVAAQAADLCDAAGANLESAAFRDALNAAPAPVQQGFARFRATRAPQTSAREKE